MQLIHKALLQLKIEHLFNLVCAFDPIEKY